MTKKRILVISVILILILAVKAHLIINSALSGEENTDNYSANVIRINDGDTVTAIVNNRKEKIRLLGIDAPELGQKPWGKRAEAYLEKLVDSSSWKVVIEYDVEKRDRFDRLLVYLWMQDGRMVNEAMVRDGYALLYTFPPNVKYVEELKSAQHEAREKRVGIWGDNGLKQKPYDYRKEHPRR